MKNDKPFLLKAVGTVGGNNYSIYSFASGIGVANINPLSNLAVIEANGSDLASLYATPILASMQTIDNGLSTTATTIQKALNGILTAFGVASTNFISGPYVANHLGLDLLFDLVSISVSNDTVTVTDKTTNYTNNATLSAFKSMSTAITDTPNIPKTLSSGVVCVMPAAPSVSPSGTINFAAIVIGTNNQQVTWSVVDINGVPDPNGGSITVAGIYTAPATPGTYYVGAMSTASSIGTIVTVTVPSTLIPLAQINWISAFTKSFSASPDKRDKYAHKIISARNLRNYFYPVASG